jgi:hypothetical protein
MRRMIYGLALIAIAALTPICASAGEQDDKEVAQQIAALLRDSGKMQKYSVGVKYKDGTVWLAGRVTSKEQMATALQIISDIDGIEQIVNNLTIAPATAAKPATKATARITNGGSKIQLATAQQEMPMPSAPAASGAVPAGYRQLQPPPAAMGQGPGRPLPAYVPAPGGSPPPAAYDQPNMPNYAWPSYAASPNYAAVSYPKQYSATAWPFIGPFYPYPQVPMGWRKVSLEWDDGWWFLDFDDRGCY